MKGKNSVHLCAVIFMSITVCIIGYSNKCELPLHALNALQGTIFPDADKLEEVCPDIMRFIACHEKREEESTSDFDEESVFRSIKNDFMDLCAEESNIRLSYLENVDCLKNIESLLPACEAASREGYELYKLTNDTSLVNARACLREGHVLGCTSVHILKTCGPKALFVFHHLMRKSVSLPGTCGPETAQDLKTKYLKSLNLDEEILYIYEEAFNLLLSV